MPTAELDAEGQRIALVGIEWAMTEEAAELDLDLACEVRDAMTVIPAEWDRAWRAAAQLIVMAAARVKGVDQEPLVLLAQELLKATKV